jgi:predicted ester cyclase
MSYYQGVWNRRDFRLLPYLFADNCKVHHTGKYPCSSVIYTPADIRRNIEKWVKIFPDLHMSVLKLITEKEYGSAYCSLKGSHLGKWMDVEPTGKTIDLEIFNMYKIEGGKISEQWAVNDAFDLLVKGKIVGTHHKVPEFI